MKTLLHVIPSCARMVVAVVAAASAAACSKSAEPVTPVTPSGGAAQQALFPGGVAFTPSDLTATPAVLPAAPPAYPNPGITRQALARFAWRQFIYLSSPAQPNGVTTPGKTPVVRGTIDPKRSFAASGDNNFYQSGKSTSNLSSNALVWETFAHRTELFPASAPTSPSLALQGDFPSLDPQYDFSIKDEAENAIGRFTVEPAQALFNNLDETTQIGQNQIFFPRTGTTPAKGDYAVLFQAKVNQVEYDYIKSKCNPGNRCDRTNLPASIELPPTAGNTAESIEVKSAWREMSPELISSGRYHTAEALYYVKDHGGVIKPQVATFGLVGLHILRKMANYPAFVYTTFEHVDNLNSSGLYYIALYDKMDYQPPIAAPVAIVNTGTSHVQIALPLAGQVTPANRYPFVANVPGSFAPPGFSGPIAVVDSHAGTSAVSQVNAELASLMASTPGFESSVWRHYRLAGIQILPTSEDGSITAPPDLLTEDFYLANNVVESSQPGIQLFKGAVMDPGPPGNFNSAGVDHLINERSTANIRGVASKYDTTVMGGCMGCHGNAQYPRDKTTGKGPSIFNFLISADSLSGNGFAAEFKNESPTELRAQGRRYQK